MMPPSDELSSLWNADSGGGKRDLLELLRRVERTARDFDRTIRFRDVRETTGGLMVAAIFVWLAIHDLTWLERAAHLWLSACGVWIVFYFRRYAKVSRKPAPEQTLLTYQRELLERYDRQIRLLKSAKYWYILPFWAGLLFSAVALLERTGNLVSFLLMVAAMTLMNAALWWLNEVMGVRHLQSKRGELSALMRNDDGVYE
jgi:hypothetical protein